METNIPKPVYVSGYIRNKKEIDTAKAATQKPGLANVIVAWGIMLYMLVLIAYLFPLFTASISGATIASIVGGRHIAKRVAAAKAEPQITINYYWRTSWFDSLLSR